jgi:hypothetical protein
VYCFEIKDASLSDRLLEAAIATGPEVGSVKGIEPQFTQAEILADTHEASLRHLLVYMSK